MKRRLSSSRRRFARPRCCFTTVSLVALLAGCSSSGGGGSSLGGVGPGGSGGGSGGTASGGAVTSGGATAAGGTIGAGGSMASGGAVTSTGGVGRTGGASGTGGSPVTGGANATGGATVGQDAGPPDKDASPATGGVLTSGGKTASGGSTALGGNAASGGSATQDALPPQDVGPNTNSDASSIPGCSAVPVTPNAIPQVSKVLCYLYSQYGNHILSGQEEGGSDSEINYIFTNTGKYPAIRAFEANGAGAGTRCVSYWNAGGLCMFGYHMGAPSTADGYNGSKTKLTPSIADALTAGTANNTVLNQRLSGLADRLLAVQAANGVVIFRPYHEAGGTWFWWSMETGADFVKLWKYTFDFMVSKGVKNTIWLLALDGSAKSAFYPGPQYVDIGGADNYNKAYDYSPMTSIYTNTAKIFPTGMPIALHECGPVPDPDQLQSTKTNWVFFSIWTSPYPETFSTVAELQKVYTSSYVVSRDELPNLK